MLAAPLSQNVTKRFPLPKQRDIIPAKKAKPAKEVTMDKRRIFIVDDHPLFRLGIRQLINFESDLIVCGEASNAEQAIREVPVLKPDLVAVDISLNDSANGIDVIKQLKALLPEMRVLVVSMHDESLYALRALRAGARGYVMKREALDSVLDAMRAVLRGEVYLSDALRQHVISKVIVGVNEERSLVDMLTDREMEIFRLIGSGLTPRQMANQLGISLKTVETHRMHLKEKFNFATSAELARFAVTWVNQDEDASN